MGLPEFRFRFRFEDRWEFFIFAAGLAARLLVFVLIIWFYGSAGLSDFADTQYEYLSLARGLASGLGYAHPNTPDYPEVSRPPGYPVYLAFFLKTGLPFWAAALIQLLTISLVPVLAMRLAGRLGLSPVLRRTAGFFTALEPLQVYYSPLILSDALASLLFLVSIYFLVLFRQEQKTAMLAASALALAAMNYFRAVGLFLVILIPLVILAAGLIQKKESVLRNLRSSAIFAAVFLAAVLPWMVRNYFHSGEFVFVSTIERQLFDYTAATVLATAEGLSYDQAQARLRAEITPHLPEPLFLKHPANRRVLLARAQEIIFAHPAQALKLYIFSLQTLLVSGNYHYLLASYGLIPWPHGGTSSFTMLFSGADFERILSELGDFLVQLYGWVALIGRLAWLTIFSLSLLGVYSALRGSGPARFGALLYLGLLLYLALVTVSLVGGTEARHRLFIQPLYFIFMAAGFSVFLKYLAGRRGQKAVLS